MAETYTKAHLVAELAGAARISKRRAEQVLSALAHIAYREAHNGFTVPGVCRLTLVTRKARRVRNPKSGQTLLIGEHKDLRVRALKKARALAAPRPEGLVTVVETPPPAAAPQPAAAPAAAAAPAPAAPVRVQFTCGHCGMRLQAKQEMVGSKVKCAKCGRVLKVPENGGIGLDLSGAASPPPAAGAPAAPGGEKFIIFACHACRQEIEAPEDMIGMKAECPTCSAALLVPARSIQPSPAAGARQDSAGGSAAMKGRTIRIELPDSL